MLFGALFNNEIKSKVTMRSVIVLVCYLCLRLARDCWINPGRSLMVHLKNQIKQSVISLDICNSCIYNNCILTKKVKQTCQG